MNSSDGYGSAHIVGSTGLHSPSSHGPPVVGSSIVSADAPVVPASPVVGVATVLDPSEPASPLLLPCSAPPEPAGLHAASRRPRPARRNAGRAEREESRMIKPYIAQRRARERPGRRGPREPEHPPRSPTRRLRGPFATIDARTSIK